MSEQRDLAAGDFSSWLAEMRVAIGGGGGADVPCGGCTACCTSSQFVHIGPDEIETLSFIPAELLFPAPGLPRGHVVLGYDERGHCPMLVDNKCSIYEHRPRTCRTYDCRIFPATGVGVDDEGKALIGRQVRRWQFSHPTPDDLVEHDAARAAATFIAAHPDLVPDAAVPTNSTQHAVLAIEIHEAFLGRETAAGHMTLVEPDLDAVRVEILRRTSPERGRTPAPPGTGRPIGAPGVEVGRSRGKSRPLRA